MTEPHVVIVGAGPAGLAVGACLARLGIPALLLEQADAVGAAWRSHYDRLHLHTDRGRSGLPFLPLPRDLPRYVPRADVVAYLETYAKAFPLDIRFGRCVAAARPAGGGWEVRTQDSVYSARVLVVATGYTREPNVPKWPGQEAFGGERLHSSVYRNGTRFAGRRVLVVGFGNSGAEIALDLCEHRARVTLAVRGPPHVVPRELFGIPILAITIAERALPPRLADALNAPVLRAVLGDLTRHGLQRPAGGPLSRIHREGRIPVIDVGTIERIKRGEIAVRPGIERFTPDGVAFSDGTQEAFDAVVLATGYRPRVDAFLQGAGAALGPEGTPRSSGRASGVPGLYFCGYYVAPTGMLREIGREAKRIASEIARTARSFAFASTSTVARIPSHSRGTSAGSM
jgi:cation diffusion facilitator CzcD-associated flavoprotein CzcO